MDMKLSDYIMVKDAAAAWGLTERRVAMLLAGGRIPGAVKVGNAWLIPKDAEKPEDRRKYNYRRPKKEEPAHE